MKFPRDEGMMVGDDSMARFNAMRFSLLFKEIKY